MAEMMFPREMVPSGGWREVHENVLPSNATIMHWFKHVHYFTCYCGGKSFTYIKDDHDELTRGGGRWYGFDPYGLRWGI